MNPEQFAVAICTVNGQQFALGESDVRFCLQSTCKPINYTPALEELGEKKGHQHIGREPSGYSFNTITLNDNGLPHNPLINAGAIRCCSLIRRERPAADRFDYVPDAGQQLSGGSRPGFNNAVCLSERETADRNNSLAYFMREKGGLPQQARQPAPDSGILLPALLHRADDPQAGHHGRHCSQRQRVPPHRRVQLPTPDRENRALARVSARSA
ncbi:hypothetical protein GCM10022407_16480 [Hymenobacter antarcticus]|uniref:glutaminase n=1 Tax=Hymenobacter antarcticus TaxID=486270 RepID=A0ABP7PUL7_9BACT